MNQYKNEKIRAMQKEVDEVVDVMRSNVEKIIEREEQLTELDLRASNLNDSAGKFQTTAKKVKRKFWWQNLKMAIALGFTVAFFIIIIIIFSVGFPSSSSSVAIPSVEQHTSGSEEQGI